MNNHALIDSIPVTLAATVFRKSLMFRDSLESPAYEELISSINLKWPEIEGEGYYEVPAHTLVGELDPAFQIASWKGESFPTIIYHHGNNERPFNDYCFRNNTFKRIFKTKNNEMPANLIVVRAPYHCCYKSYRRQMSRLSTFTALLSVSVMMVQALTEYARGNSSRVVVSGISLGGWVTNLHRTFFNTADVYIPLLAGTIPSDVFINSVYRKLTAGRVHENPAALKEIIDFEDQFSGVEEENVFPLLARYDQVIRFEQQEASYQDNPVAVINKGHFTGALSANDLRKHIRPHITPERKTVLVSSQPGYRKN